jgi:pimeloyl-ACP methyl ester carboxylesterase
MIIFAHGMFGNPGGAKLEAMRQAGVEVVAPDGQKQVLHERIDTLEKLVVEHGHLRPVLGGSSYGGLAASYVATRYPELIRGLLLAAPAFSIAEDPVPRPQELVIPLHVPTAVIHGRQDAIVPHELSLQLKERSGGHVSVEIVEDNHRLEQSLGRLCELARYLGA